MFPSDPHEFNKEGMRYFYSGLFSIAEEYFSAGLARTDPKADAVLHCDLLYNMAKTHQRRGEHRKALALFKTLCRADGRRYIRYKHGIALSNYKLGHYVLALQQFEKITEKYVNFKRDYWFFRSSVGVASCCCMLKRYRTSLGLLMSLVQDDPANRAVYLKEVERVRVALSDELAGLSRESMVAANRRGHPVGALRLEGDSQLCEILSPLLLHFPEIRLPIKALYVDGRENTAAGLRQLGAPNLFVTVSQSYRSESEHVLLYNKKFWAHASRSALRGNLAHELMHRAWEDSGANLVFFPWTKDTLTYGCLERIIDLCLLGKGLAEDLYKAKKYIEDNAVGGERIDYGVEDISRLMFAASRFEMGGFAESLPKFEIPASISSEISDTHSIPVAGSENKIQLDSDTR